MNSKKIIGLLLSASMVIATVAPAFADATTDKTTEYNYGDSITISRTQADDAKFTITNPSGDIVLNDAMTGGKKSFTFKIPADSSLGWTEGTYTVKIGDETTTFVIKAAPAEKVSFKSWNSSDSTIYVNGVITLIPTFNNLPSDATISYSHTDSYVDILPSSDGKSVKVTGLKVGTAKIVATAKDKDGEELASGTATVTIRSNSSNNNGGSGGSSTSTSGGSSIAGGSGTSSGSVGIYSRPDAYNPQFSDMNEAAWAENAVYFLARKGIIKGYEDGTFAPNASITRAEFAKLISTLYNLVTETSKFGAPSFADVPKDQWYFNYVEVCAQLGIVTGYEDGNFQPNKIISRQEMAAMIYRTANIMGTALTATEAEKTFADAGQIYDYAAAAVSTLQKAGIVEGTSETTFEPTAGCTRAQAATIIYNLYTRYAK